jgi:hypothetical protein
MVYYLFAMPREAEQIEVENKYIVGINAVDLPDITAEDTIVNIGYCGATRDISVGTIVEPSIVYSAITGESAKIDKIFGCEDIKCFTADDFVTEPIEENKNIYDMELYKLTKLPHKKIYALKIVSDNLNESDCEQYNDQEAWAKIKNILEKFKNEIV